MDEDPLQARLNERKIYEDLVTVIVDTIFKEFKNDEMARLRIYSLISENFDGMVRALKPPKQEKSALIQSIEKEEKEL